MRMLTLALTIGLATTAGAADDYCPALLDHEVRRLGSDQTVRLCDEYRGKVLLIVNTASRCAFTSQYEDLETLYGRYRDRGLEVLGFPSNDFGQQEPGTEQEIKQFCKLTYGVKFPMFAKTRVKKDNADPLYRALGEAAGAYPRWNFYKYLVGRDGRLIDSFNSFRSPTDGAIEKAVERAL